MSKLKNPKPRTAPLYDDPEPGTRLVLYVVAQDWSEAPTEKTFEVEHVVPAKWDAAAIRALMETIARATRDRVGTSKLKPRIICRLHYDRPDVYGRKFYLTFWGDLLGYAVALPAIPKPALVDFLCDSNLEPSFDFYVNGDIAVAAKHADGPRPRRRLAGGVR
jgi:hypothetical protein